MPRNLSILLCIILFIGTGCYGRTEVNDTVVAMGRGLDIEGENCVYSAQLALPKPREGSLTGPQYIVATEKASGFAEAARRLSLFLPRQPIWAMANTIVLGEKMVRQGPEIYMDFLMRNRNTHPNSFLFVAIGASPEEILKTAVPTENYSALGLEKIIQRQENSIGIYIPVTGVIFANRMSTEGIEPFVPQIRLMKGEDQEKLILDGTAIFREGRMVGSLNEQESRGLRFLQTGMISGGLFAVDEPGNSNTGNQITLELIRSQSTIKPSLDGNRIKMQIQVEAEGNYYEQNSSDNIFSIENVPAIEAQANQAIKHYIMACITKCQELESDVLGWGTLINFKYPKEWETLKASWPQYFSRMEFEVSVNYKLRRGYLLDGSFKFN